MQYSDNYNLKLPQRGVDRANVDDLDDNFEVIDGALADDRQIGLLMYDSTATYNTGRIVGYENPSTHRIRAYRCLEDNVTGPWDATKWAQTTLAAEIEAGGGGGGSSTLAGLSDVDLGTLADGEVLTYDATEGKWVNAEGGSGGASELSDLDDVSLTTPTEGQILTYDGDEWVNADAPDVDVTKTAEGNPIEVSDSADAPLVKCVSAITGSQDLHGYDKPWVGGGGKNILNPTPATSVVSGITMEVQNDGGIRVHGTSGGSPARFSLDTNISMSAGNYTMSMRSSNSNIRFISNGNNGFDYTSSYGDFSKTFNITEQPTVQYIYIDVAANVTIDTTFYLQLEKGSSVTDFEPYSNICPITAYTEGEIEVRGKNLWNPADVTEGYYISESGVITADSSFMYSGFMDVSESNTYVLGYTSTTDATTTRIHGYDANKEWVRQITTSGSSGAGRKGVNIGITSDIKYVAVSTRKAFTNFQFEKGSSVTDYEPYTSTTHTTTFPSAIYRGSEDVVKGEVTKDWGIATLDGSETWNRHLFSTASLNAFYTTFNGGQKSYPDGQMGVFNEFNTGTVGSVGQNGNAFVGTSTVQIRLDEFDNVADLKAFLANNPIQFAYELATPTTSSVTPTNLPIKSLSGYSHIESSTGDMEIEYITGKYQPIVDLISESSGGDSQHHYSTDEQVVGTWIDGSTIYETTIYISALPASNNPESATQYAHDISNINEIVDFEAIAIWPSGVAAKMPYTQISSSGLNSTGSLDITVDTTNIVIRVGTDRRSLHAYVTIRYTKTSNRSLSKGPTESEKTSLEPISEPLETKVDNLSKDDTELKEEDESKEIEEITEEPEEVIEEPEEEPEVTEEEPTEEPVDPEPSKEEEADER